METYCKILHGGKKLHYRGGVKAWCDTTEEQARYTLHSHILLFIELFDLLISLLWSDEANVKEEAIKELVEYMKQCMSSTYDLAEEDFAHKKTYSPIIVMI